MILSIKAKYKLAKSFLAIYFLAFVLELLIPLKAFALTSGPTQPEVQSFEPSGTTDMVNTFSGDFTYNIPLLELPGPNGGYPFNMAYHSGITMDDEASWVGLGWSLNPGVINRNMRGIPDDFNGDVVKTDLDIKKNYTVNVGFTLGLPEIWSFDMSKGQKDSKAGAGGGLDLSISCRYNSYRGFGASVGVGLDAGFSNAAGSMKGGAGLGITMDSDEGASLNVSGNLGGAVKKGNMTGSIGLGVNSRSGLKNLTLGLGGSKEGKKNREYKDSEGNVVTGKRQDKIASGSGNVSFANSSFTPHVNMPMKGFDLGLSFKIGPAAGGAFPNFGFNASYSQQKLRTNIKDSWAYGYLYLDEGAKNASREAPGTMIDVNREKDGTVTRFTPNLASPSLTYDVLSASGQGMMNVFRPYRNDVGATFEEYSVSKSTGGGIGGDVGVGYPVHLGLNGDVHHTESSSGKWSNRNSFVRSFMTPDTNSDFENVYFRSMGEQTSEDTGRMNFMIGNDQAIKVDLDGSRDKPSLTNTFSNLRDEAVSVASNADRKSIERKPRQNTLVALKNNQLDKLKEFDLSYYTNTVLSSSSATTYRSATKTPVNRATRQEKPIAHHMGGITTVNNDGMRYVYGIPAYNNKQVEHTFSIKSPGQGAYCSSRVIKTDTLAGDIYYKVGGTDQFRQKTNMPPYAHSYLLTCVLGPDYIDVDNNGPSENDFGYWVKFDYIKAYDDFRWRAPYQHDSANYLGGFKIDEYDDKGTYMYGEKEMWYLSSAETKTHKAIFILSPRHDGLEAAGELTSSTKRKPYKLDRIELYTLKDFHTATTPKPLQTVNFEYDYELCGNVPNNDGEGDPLNADKGKLTLKKVFFTYENSNKGELSPYQFHYGVVAGEPDPSNPDYNPLSYDRWGQYRPDGSACDKIVFPYVNQDMDKAERDYHVTAWHLTDIDMPSGSSIHVNYESNDYSYVQNKQAMQMFKITSLHNPLLPSEIYTSSNLHSDYPGDRKVYFELKDVIPVSTLPDTLSPHLAKLYLDDTKQIYYKILAWAKKPNQEEYKEYFSGYADILGIGVDPTCEDFATHTHYDRAYIVLDHTRKADGSAIRYHPFTLAILQSLKANLPQIAYKGDLTTADPDPQGAEAILEMVKAIGAAFASIKELFTTFYKDKTAKLWASKIDVDQSYIRLNCPNKTKYGGGVRVRSVEISDNWNTASGESGSTYGQAYDYTTIEDGQVISSGVATFEPSIGGEENCLKYAKNFPHKVSITSENNLFFEYPINESYYPAPSIGYSKVTVRSLNTRKVMDPAITSSKGYGATGVTEYEFYTAKDYPVIASETSLMPQINSKSMKYLRLPIPLPGLGSLNWDVLAASQGYCIQLNDMHGKLKKQSNYEIDGTGRKSNEISSVEYFYFDEEKKFIKPGTIVPVTYRVLKNEVPVLISDPNPANLTEAKIETRTVGLDYEMFTDQRQSATYDGGGGVSFNIEFATPIPFPFPWPNITYNENELSLAVTNKIIHRSGILRKVVATDGQSIVETNNLCFDRYTGAPLLTTVTNNFDDNIWSYRIPAHMHYDGMGPAYKNIGLRLRVPCANLEQVGSDSIYNITDFNPCSYLAPGDELILGGGAKAIITEATNNTATFVLLNSVGTTLSTMAADPGCTAAYDMYLVRSGRRNLLNAEAGIVTALKNPTKGRTIETCEQQYLRPHIDTTNYDSCFSMFNIDGLIDSFTSRAFGAGGNVYIPFSDELFAGSPTYGSMSSEDLQYAIENGYIGVSIEDNVLTWVNPSGNSCSWALYEVEVPEEDELNLILQNFSQLPEGADLDVPYSNPVQPPLEYQGRFLLAKFGVYALYQSPANCFCNTIFPRLAGYDTIIVPDTTINIDSVINCSAGVYTDYWSTDFKDTRFNDDDQSTASLFLNSTNEYINGKWGIWRNWMNFVYHTNRRQDSLSVKVRKDGSYKMALFDWENPLRTHCDSNWVKTKEVTRYSGYNYEVENKDALNNFSSALYSFNGKLPVAVGSNTKYAEFGFEGFEEYESSTPYNQYQNATANINITTQIRDVNVISGYCDTVYDYVTFMGSRMGPLYFMNGTTLSRLKIGVGYENCIITGRTIGFWGSNPNETKTTGPHQVRPISSGALTAYNATPIFNPENWSFDFWVFGKIGFPRCVPVSGSVSVTDHDVDSVEIADYKAHTGIHSIKILSRASFTQTDLALEKDKKYEFSAWVSRDETYANVSTYKQSNGNPLNNCSVDVLAVDANNNILGILCHLEPSGQMVNKWQKVEGAFSLSPLNSTAATHIRLRFNPGDISGTTRPAYFDDVRIFPSDGNMKSYVYSNTDYKLAATLDNNNYATMYYYDEEGNLYLTKQETERGIFTIQESRTNMPR